MNKRKPNIMLDGQMYDYFDKNNNIQSGGDVLTTQPADQTYSRGLNSAQMQMGSQIAQSTGDIGVNILTGVMQKKDNERARKEARELSEITRQDKLKQQNIEIAFRKKQQEQEEQQFQLQQRAATFNQRLSTWQNVFKRNYENTLKSRQSAEELWNELSQVDENKRNELLRGFI